MEDFNSTSVLPNYGALRRHKEACEVLKQAEEEEKRKLESAQAEVR